MNKVSKTTNILIPSLISLFNQYNDNLKTRLRADTLFLSFDEKSKKTFNKFINLSNDRFKLMKYGGTLNHIISNQKQNYSKINDDIQNDLLFNTNYSNIERKKLIKSVNEFKSKEIFSVRDKLFESLKQRTSIDILLRKKQMLERKEKNKIKNKNRNPSKKNTNISKNTMTLSDENEKNNKPKLENKKEIIEINTQDEIKEDQINVINGIESYKNLLKTKKNSLNNKENKNVNDNNNSNNNNNNRFIKINKSDFKDIETHLNENNIKILSYNEESLNKIEKKKNEDEKFDINTLYKIKTSNNIYKNQKMSFLPKLKPIDTEGNNFISGNLNTNENKNENENENENSNYKNIRSLTFNNNYDMKNTIKIIKKEAYNGVMLGEKLLNQKNKFDTYYKRRFPKYAFNQLEKNNKLKQHNKIKNEKEKGNTPKIIKKRKLSNFERIMEDYQKIYDNKKQIWIQEDKEKEINEKNKIKKQNDIINFLLNLDDRNNQKRRQNK